MEGKGRGWDVTKSLDSGIINGAKMLKEAHVGLIQDARAALTPKQFQLFMDSPFMRDFAKGLDGLSHTTNLFRKAADGHYQMLDGKNWITIDSFDTFNQHFLKAAGKTAHG